MLTMTDINTIRNLRNNHDKSINHIAKELDVNWRTAKKYADDDLLPQPKARKKTGMMYTEKWEASFPYGFQKMLSCQIKSVGLLKQ